MGDLSADYDRLATRRTTVLQRARDASRVTIPGLIPEDGQNEHTVYAQPYQSVGSRGVSNISSRLLLTTLPSFPFFRLDIAQDAAAQLGASLSDAQEKLSVIGGTAASMASEFALMPVMGEAYRHLVVGGNALVNVPDKGRPRMWRLDQYVVRRNSSGEWVQIVIKESVPVASLSEEQQAALAVDPKPTGSDPDEVFDSEADVDLYTGVVSINGTAEWWQEIRGIEVPGTRGKAPHDACGWFPLRWLAVPGSDYGRSHVTEYIGDLMSLEDLNAAMVKFAAEAARILRIVDPNSGLDIEELAAAETGDWLTGYGDRIKTLQLDKSMDWQVMNSLAERIEGRVSNAFLLRSQSIRNAERVTAEEIRMVAEELDTVLGGTYSVMAAEFQLPLAKRLMYLGAKQKRFPALPKSIKPIITTGFDSLGRSTEVNTLRMFMSDIVGTLGQNAIQQYFDGTEIARRFGVGYNIQDLKSLLKTADQMAQEQQASAMQQAAMTAAPQIAKGAVDATLQPKQ